MKRIAILACAPTVVAAAMLVGTTAHATPSAAHRTGTVRAAGLPRLALTLTGKSIRAGGALVSGGVRITATVTGEQMGSPALIRLNPGVTPAQFFAAMQASHGDPNGVRKVGAIVVDFQANPGRTWVDAWLAPARYVALDTANQNPARWPFTVFTIARSAAPAALPAPAASVGAYDYGFTGPGTWRSGQLIRFWNKGAVVHMIAGARAPSAAVAARIAALLRAGKDNRAQGLADGFYSFAGPISRGGSQLEQISVPTGYWVIACFMDTNGREHTTLGMVRVIHIVP